MAKSIFLFLILGFLFSCNQSDKVHQADSKADTNVSQNKKDTIIQIDAIKASPSNFKLLLENQNVRVLEYTLNPGDKDQWHTHPAKSSYVVSGGQLKVYLENGDTIMANETTGTASWMDAVGKHFVENIGKTPVKIVLTEIKSLEH